MTQKGETLLIGFAGNTYTGYVMEDLTLEPTADVQEYRDESNNVIMKVITNPAKAIQFTAMIKGANCPALAVGDAVSINNVSYMCTKASVKFSRLAAQLQFAGIKETSMTYT